ncbi:MAG: glycoside hydrolase family 78 protein [Armatimonadota bacterium]|nr:glycoside hydrolase family 78 protein [Armatimonadota bacterium]
MSHAAAPVTVQQLRCEYRVNPLGIDVPRPRLSWILESNQRGQKQTAYQIVVAASEASLKAGQGDLWDSGKVASDETMHIPYAGRALASGQEVWWAVRVWDKDGKPLAYSTPARWTMGLMNPAEEWKAQWIGLEALPDAPAGAANLNGLSWVWFPEGNPTQNAPAGVRYFRKRIDLPSERKVKAARFILTADDRWTLFVNGQEVGKTKNPGDEYAWKQPATIDVKERLVAGANVLAVAAENAKVTPAGLVGRLTVEFETGEPLVLPIDASWKTAQQAPEGWQTAAFDDTAWVAAKVVAKMGDQPWGNVSPGSSTLPPSPFLRKTFQINKPIRRAYAYATALGLYELHLNGQRVGEDIFSPGWSDYKKRVYYQTYDVTPLLKTGANAVGLIVGDGWATGHVGNGGRNRYGIGRPKVSAQINVTYTDGTTETVLTDGTWKAAYGPIVEQDLLDGEVYDATKEMPDWDRAEFNDATWQPVDVHPAWPAKIEAYPGVPVRQQMELKPKAVTQPSPGAYVFDLGQNIVGWARLAVAGATERKPGTKIRLRFAEMLNPDGTIYTTNLRGARCIDSYTLKGVGSEVWEPRFTFHGFRYVEVTGYPGTPTADAITGIVVHSDTPKVGTFACSNPMVNQLQQNIEWGQRGNFLEVPTDCPQRDERLGWMGDAQVFIRTACNNMDVASFFTKWMVDVDDDRRGPAFTDVAPDVCCGANTPAWADAGVIVPWTTYLFYGDKQIIEKHYAAMTGYIDNLRETNPNLLWEKNRGSDYGDWLSIGADTPKDVIGTAYFAYSTALLARMARVVGREDDARKYETLFDGIKAAFNKAYVDANGRIKGNTQTCYLMALHMNLLPEEKRAAALQHLVSDIEAKGWHLSTGFVGVSYLNPVLSRFGRTDVAYRLLNQDTFPSWLFPVKHGATTIWERWDGWTPEKGFQNPGMNSFNHYALGSVGEWLYDTVAGIAPDPAQPGFKHIIIRPRPGGGLTWARAEYHSIHGRIAADWKTENDGLALNVTIPANTTATVYIPTTDQNKVLVDGQPLEKSQDVRFLRQEDGRAVLTVGSGSYQFKTQ